MCGRRVRHLTQTTGDEKIGVRPSVHESLPRFPEYPRPFRFLLVRASDEAVIVTIDVEIVADDGTAIVDVGSDCGCGARKGDGFVPATLQNKTVGYTVTYAVELAHDAEALVDSTGADIDAAGNLNALKVAARGSKIASIGVEADDVAFVSYLISVGEIGARKIQNGGRAASQKNPCVLPTSTHWRHHVAYVIHSVGHRAAIASLDVKRLNLPVAKQIPMIVPVGVAPTTDDVAAGVIPTAFVKLVIRAPQ